ncbi:MAG TPA: hypothetical protein VFH73_02895 [Polyangia bacterium]|jgi:hypothetical protein|nr:hypothetical protein [Polyangia bacterium]
MRASVLLAFALATGVAMAGGCDLRPLRQDQLLGAGGGGGRDGGGGDSDGAMPATDGDAGDGSGGGGDSLDAPRGCPAIPCADYEICDVPTMVCKLRTGMGILSGSVKDACTGQGIDARVGIAGRRQCTFAGKGSYYFKDLPEVKLALIAFKQGYKAFQVDVIVSAAGTVQDIVLQPDTPGGCADPPPVEVACTCNIPGC